MKRQVDWVKICLLFIVFSSSFYAIKGKFNLPDFGVATSAVSIPEPDEKSKKAVQPLVDIRSKNLSASRVLGDYLASYAWILENGKREKWSSTSIAKNLELGGEHLQAMKSKVGALPGFSKAINDSLDNLWGERDRQISKEQAAKDIYACGWALRISSGVNSGN